MGLRAEDAHPSSRLCPSSTSALTQQLPTPHQDTASWYSKPTSERTSRLHQDAICFTRGRSGYAQISPSLLFTCWFWTIFWETVTPTDVSSTGSASVLRPYQLVYLNHQVNTNLKLHELEMNRRNAHEFTLVRVMDGERTDGINLY